MLEVNKYEDFQLIYLSRRHGRKLLLASVRQPLYFKEYPIRILSLPCNSSSIHLLLGQPFGDRFCTMYQLLLVFLATLFYIDILSNHYFLRLWGKPCTVSSTSHSPSLLEPVPIQPSLTWSHCVSFRLHYSPAGNSSQFSTSSTFSPRTFFWISHISLRHKDKAKSLPHHFPLSFFAGKYSPRHSVLKGPWQLPFPVLAGLKVPVYKVSFVIRTFLPGGNCHQEAVKSLFNK